VSLARPEPAKLSAIWEHYSLAQHTMTANKIRDSLWKLLFLRPLDTAPREIIEAQEAARKAIAQARGDEVEVVIRAWQSDPAPASPTEMPSDELLKKWIQAALKAADTANNYEFGFFYRRMAHFAIQWARSGAGEAPEPQKIKEALKHFLELNPFTATIKQFREAQDAVRDAIAQAEAGEEQEPALELAKVVP